MFALYVKSLQRDAMILLQTILNINTRLESFYNIAIPKIYFDLVNNVFMKTILPVKGHNKSYLVSENNIQILQTIAYFFIAQ